MSTEKKRKEGTGHGVDLQDRQKVEPPKKYKVILHNDDFTPMDFVIIVLMDAFSFSFQKASAIMMQVHEQCKGIAGVYSKEIAKVAVGDTITWLPASKGHNVEIIAAPDGYDIPKKSKNGKEVSITFEVPGIYYYWCTPHKGMGMIGLVVVGDDTSNKDKIAKAKALGKSKKKLKKLLSEL